MNTELITLQHELTVAKQQNEILELKHQLQLAQAKKASKLEDSLFSPRIYEHYKKVASMMSESGIVPRSYIGKPHDILIAMEMGYQLGFPLAQSLQDIAVINGRPCLWGDGLLALILTHPELENFKEEPLLNKDNAVIGYKCTVKRKNIATHEQVFTLEDAKTAGLLGKAGPWTQYPRRMLQMRARAFALRDVFSDALRGLQVVEEQQDIDIIDVEPAQVIPEKMKQVDKLKQIIGIGDSKNENEIDGNINNSIAGECDSAGFDSLQTTSDSDEIDARSEKDSDSGDMPISREQLDRIKQLFYDKQFSSERINKACARYEVTKASELSYKNAQKFIKQLEKAQ